MVHDDPTDPANMSAQERVEELAAIFAAGFLRLRQRAALPTSQKSCINPLESGQIGLDVCGQTRPDGQHG